jgi:hypothetical protein
VIVTNSMTGVRRAVSCLCALLLFGLSGCRLWHAGQRVAFLGDSITEGWYYPTVNFGVHGNTTTQMLDRFDRLIPGHGYNTVVILGGTNDILLGIDPGTTTQNLQKLAERTIQQHAEPVLCEVPPIYHSYNHADTRNYRPQVLELNSRHHSACRHSPLEAGRLLHSASQPPQLFIRRRTHETPGLSSDGRDPPPPTPFKLVP